jgi:hypothetical protein
VQELDRLGAVVKGHPLCVPPAGTGYRRAELTFTATARTMFVRVGGLAELQAGGAGAAVFDTFGLDGPAGPALPALSGAIVGGGAPAPGAGVATLDGKQRATSGPDGYYSLSLPNGVYPLRFAAPGFYAQRRTVTVRRPTVFTVDLVPVDGNLLANAGFDDGWPDGWETSTVADGMVRAGRTPSLFSPNYPLFFHTGEEATEILSGSGKGAEGRVFQKVAAQPNRRYAASAWFRAYGPSWGKDPRQRAGLFVEQLDASGAVAAKQDLVWATRYDDWQKLSLEVTTGPRTAFLRVGGYAYLMDDYNTTTYRALFDTFELREVGGGS